MTFSSKKHCAAAIVAGLILVALAYANTLHSPFQFDDGHVIRSNIYIRDLGNWKRFFTDAHTFSSVPENATYRPLLTLSYALDYAASGTLSPVPFHVTQIALLLVLTVLLIVLYRRVFEASGAGFSTASAAIFAALVFALHTVNTETMNLISARSDLASTLAVVAALVIYIVSPRLRKTQLYLLPIVVGALTKATVVAFAPILFVYVALFSNGSPRERTRRAAIASLPSFVLAALVLPFLSRMNAPEWQSGGGNAMAYIRTQTFVWLHYTRLFFLPVGLTADTDLTTIARWDDTRVVLGILFVALLLVVIARTAREERLRPISFGLAWYVIALLPTTVFPLAEVANEHRLFFPYIGLSMAVVWALRLFIAQHERIFGVSSVKFAGVAAVAVLLVLAVSTHVRNETWQTEESLWRDVTEKSPMNGRALMNYGLTRMRAGQLAEAKRLLDRAHPLTPNYPTLEINMGVVEAALGNTAAAEGHFNRALALNPDATSHYFYARWLIESGRAVLAESHLQKAIAQSPASIDARILLMYLYAAMGEPDKLRHVADETLAVDPTDAVAFAFTHGRPVFEGRSASSLAKLGATFLRDQQPVEAIEAFRESLKLAPADGATRAALAGAFAKAGITTPSDAMTVKATPEQGEHWSSRATVRDVSRIIH